MGLDVLPNNSHLIRGAVETINLLRSKYNCKIGSSTGYTSEIMAKLRPQAAAGVYGGMWTVGIAKTGNYVGMTETQMDQADPDELEAKVAKARKILRDSGAHYVIDTINDLPGVIEKINDRLAMGMSPST